MTTVIKEISDFDGAGVVVRFIAVLPTVGSPCLRIELDCGVTSTRLDLSPPDLGNFAAHVEDARKKLLGLWMEERK